MHPYNQRAFLEDRPSHHAHGRSARRVADIRAETRKLLNTVRRVGLYQISVTVHLGGPGDGSDKIEDASGRGPGKRGGGSYGRRTIAAAKRGVAKQISADGKLSSLTCSPLSLPSGLSSPSSAPLWATPLSSPPPLHIYRKSAKPYPPPHPPFRITSAKVGTRHTQQAWFLLRCPARKPPLFPPGPPTQQNIPGERSTLGELNHQSPTSRLPGREPSARPRA